MLMRNKHITIILSSNNEAKISATNKICSNLYPNFNLIHLDALSGVSETPDNDDEAIEGCHKRIHSLEKDNKYDVDYIIALEGLVSKHKVGTFLYGWAVIKDVSKNKFYYGCSGKFSLPDKISQQFSKKIKLSDIVLKQYPQFSNEKMNILGTNGLLTKGLYSRVDEFEIALKCAFGSIIAENL